MVLLVLAIQQFSQLTARDTTGMKPICDMTANDSYKGLDGGLYGRGKNTPPEPLLASAKSALSKIQPLDSDGKPSQSGKIVFVSISMSNATMEFSAFKRIADSDPAKSAKVQIVDCAQGGKAMEDWVAPNAQPWQEAERRLMSANATDAQVQVAWVKIANKGPRGDFTESGAKLKSDTEAVIANAKSKFPNLRLVYLSSRIYAGYATTRLNPEPYAYEGGFVARNIIQAQPAWTKSSTNGTIILWGALPLGRRHYSPHVGRTYLFTIRFRSRRNASFSKRNDESSQFDA